MFERQNLVVEFIQDIFVFIGALLTTALFFMTSSENSKLLGKMFPFQKGAFIPLSQNLAMLTKTGEKK